MTQENQEQTQTLEENETYVFPNLVYKEFLAVIAATLVLTIWSILQNAPLKEIATPNNTENPAKAPWYFVGLQELLVYFDPWIAGVVIPGLIIFGLVAIPYIDVNPRGVGEYNCRERKLACFMFLFGYILWFVLIFIGQFLRGPNWQFYWPWEEWGTKEMLDPALINLPNYTGIIILLLYFGLGLTLPALINKKHYQALGKLKYCITWILALLMFGIVGKIILRILFQVKYIISTNQISI